MKSSGERQNVEPAPSANSFTITHSFSIILSLLFILTDFGLNIFLAVKFYQHEDLHYFKVMLAFTVVPSVTMTAFSLCWYVKDYRRKRCLTASYVRWAIRIFFHCCQLGPVVRCIEAIELGYKSRGSPNSKRLLKYYNQEHYYASNIKMLQSFMEGCPMILLQMYIIAENHHAEILKHLPSTYTGQVTWMKIVICLLSVSWALTYNRVKKIKGWDMRMINGVGSVVQILWYISTLLARFLSLALFAVSTQVGFTITVSLHWLLMTIWLYLKKTTYFNQGFLEMFYNMSMALAYIFHYIKVKDVPTRRHYLIYYNLIFLEGAIMVSYWFNQVRDYIKTHPELEGTKHAYIPIILFCTYILSFLIGIILMVSYYKYLHPSKDFIRDHRWHNSSVQFKREQQENESTDSQCQTQSMDHDRRVDIQGDADQSYIEMSIGFPASYVDEPNNGVSPSESDGSSGKILLLQQPIKYIEGVHDEPLVL